MCVWSFDVVVAAAAAAAVAECARACTCAGALPAVRRRPQPAQFDNFTYVPKSGLGLGRSRGERLLPF